jgi:signal transduction histidine kinase
MNNVIDYGKIEAGEFVVNFFVFNLEQLLQHCLELFRDQATGKGLALNLNFDRKIPPAINSDPEVVRQLMANLLSNAIKYTDVGSVTVIATLVAPATVRV